MKKKKLSLKELQVESFVTSENSILELTPELKGGTPPVTSPFINFLSWTVTIPFSHSVGKVWSYVLSGPIEAVVRAIVEDPNSPVAISEKPWQQKVAEQYGPNGGVW